VKILHISRFFYPHIGGVEKHVFEVAKSLKRKGNRVRVLTEKYDNKLEDVETVDGIKVVRFSYPHIKFFGLIFIWYQIFKKRKLIQDADVVHIHDVFIWHLPFKFLFPNTKVFTTAHGLEPDNPFSKTSIWQKRLAVRLSAGTIGVGTYLEKYTGTKFDMVTYGAISPNRRTHRKINNFIVYVGRLEKNTGLCKFLEWIKRNPRYRVEFCGDGQLRKRCEKYGTVQGFTDPTPYYKKAEYCMPGGSLGAMEALNSECELKIFWHNKLRCDIWKMSPFYQLKGEELKKWAREQTWDKLADEYLDLYNRSK
jgi:glycosyltransferase involved in cell wall biosynthesis